MREPAPAAPVAAVTTAARSGGGSRSLAPSPVEAITAALLRLARLPAADLKRALDLDGGDAFGLKGLEAGQCPAAPVDWLPARAPPGPAAHFRHRAETKAGGRQTKPSLVWYEHLSKAGGTSFCKLAKKNMPRKEIPAYYCMPSEPGMPDARVGQWSNDKLGAWFDKQGESLVSNEWEPFPVERLALQAEVGSGGAEAVPLEVVLVTTIRDPLNRLLSAYRFWGVLHNPSEAKPPAARWLRNMEARAKADAASPRGMGKGVGTGRDFIARVGQPNFATWKFSGGSLPVFGAPFDAQPRSTWEGPFSTAVATLCRFDLAIPMELLSAHPEPLGALLGWGDFSESHVVPSGKVVDTKAEAELGPADHAALWDANRLDLVLYAWVKATYLARIHCGGGGV